MEALAVLVVVGVLVLAHVLRFRMEKKTAPEPQLLTRRPLSEPEQSFYQTLSTALPEHHVLPQVCFSRFLYTRVGQRTDEYAPWSGGQQMVVDYLVCDQAFDIVCAIELEEAADSANRNRAKVRILSQAGIRLVKWHVCRPPSTAEIRQAVLNGAESQAPLMA